MCSFFSCSKVCIFFDILKNSFGCFLLLFGVIFYWGFLSSVTKLVEAKISVERLFVAERDRVGGVDFCLKNKQTL